jgi:hypothetical protein
MDGYSINNRLERQTAALSYPAQEGPLGTPAMRDPNPEPAMKPSWLVVIRTSLPWQRGQTGGVSSPLNVRCAKVWLQALHRHSVVGMVIDSFTG